MPKVGTSTRLYFPNSDTENAEVTGSFSNKELKKSWDKIPSSVRKFYEEVHNGFFYYATGAMGLVHLDFVTFFDEDEWEIIDELKEPIQINLKTTFGFF